RAVKALKREIRVLGVEPETAAPAALSHRAGSAQSFPDWQASFVDGAGGQSVFSRMGQRNQAPGGGFLGGEVPATRGAMRAWAERARVSAEGAGAMPLAAAMGGKAGPGPIVAIVSGGNIDL